MARKSGSVVPGQEQLPVQPVDRPILCNPYEEPRDHWVYDKETGAASRAGTRRPASYWYKTDRTGSAQLTLTGLAEEERDDLPLNRLLAGERPSFSNPGQDFFPRLIDPAQDASLAALRRIACKMATGSGKTVVMSMVVAWAFCNRGQNPATTLFPNGILIC